MLRAIQKYFGPHTKKKTHEAKEELYRAKDARKFNEKLNRSRRGFVPQADMYRDNHGNLLTSERESITMSTLMAMLQAPKVGGVVT